jgi:DNA repair exonuclease SbcCD ATPase subunit
MRINEISWKNYKSYGGVKQTIKFDKDRGQLILLQGPNGNGKSAFMDVFDLAIFGQVLNKRGTRLANKNLPNRVNGDLEVYVDLDTMDNNLKIRRGIQNSSASMKTELKVDDENYKKANKVDDKIIESVKFDYKTFKSFISMDVNNFKNFISLTPEEKRILLDKLFNLEVINELNKILKQLQKNNEINLNGINREIQIYRSSIDELQSTIDRVNEKNQNDKTQRIAELKQILSDNKENFINLDAEHARIEQELGTLQGSVNELNQKWRDIDRDIAQINEKIALYNSGKCPTCLTKLVGDLNLLPEFEERLEQSTKVKSELFELITNTNSILNQTKNDFDDVVYKYNTLSRYLTAIKTELKLLKEEKTDSVEEFIDTLDSQKSKLAQKETESLDVLALKQVYNMLLPMWGENGIKRDIIDSIIGPLNDFIKEDLVHLKMRFRVSLDNNFDAHITEYGSEVDPDTLSTGEAKKINLIIMLAYIKMLRLKNEINILFLDEVFASVDVEGISDLLTLFKKFSNERSINIILVHHAELKEHMFDRILYVKKSSFSYIEEKTVSA